MSRVDIIIPCYNYAQFLPACVESVLKQRGVDVRVLIIDDASQDQTADVCARLAEDSRVEYRIHKSNKGHIETYNEGLAWAQGDYTLLLSADDLLIDGALERVAALMDNEPGIALTYGKEIIFQSDKPLPEIPPINRKEHRKIMTGKQFLELACTLAYNFVPTPTAVVRTGMQKRIGGYLKELPHSGDIEMWLRFGAHGSVGFINDYQAYYRKHPANMALQYSKVMDYQQLIAAYDTLFREYGNQIEDSARLNALALRNLSRRIIGDAYAASEMKNWKECHALFELAGDLYPGLKSEKLWSRLLWKQRLKLFLPLILPIRDGIRRLLSSVSH